jgi:hypothetical protein
MDRWDKQNYIHSCIRNDRSGIIWLKAGTSKLCEGGRGFDKEDIPYLWSKNASNFSVQRSGLENLYVVMVNMSVNVV